MSEEGSPEGAEGEPESSADHDSPSTSHSASSSEDHEGDAGAGNDEGSVEAEPEGDASDTEDGKDAEDKGDSPDGEKEEVRRPISVRDLMPPPSSRRPRPTDRRPQREGPRAPDPSSPDESEGSDAAAEARKKAQAPADADEEDLEDHGSAPTPVRVAMDAPPPGDSRPPQELPSRRFDVDGEEWIARITGRSVTGTRPDPGALLMQLSFFRPDRPETPLRKLLTVDRSLHVLYDKDLEELFRRSRPAEIEDEPGAE